VTTRFAFQGFFAAPLYPFRSQAINPNTSVLTLTTPFRYIRFTLTLESRCEVLDISNKVAMLIIWSGPVEEEVEAAGVVLAFVGLTLH
jgi:hypothetical protein